MSRPISKASALSLALFPLPALAHDDHQGLRGLVHVLTEPAHLGLALLAIGLGGLALSLRRRVRRSPGGTDAA